jgi:hypothetical protein
MKRARLFVAAVSAVVLGSLTLFTGPASAATKPALPKPDTVVHAQSLTVVASDFCFQSYYGSGLWVGENSGEGHKLTATATGCGGNEEFTLYENASPFYECLYSNWDDEWVGDNSATDWVLQATAGGCGAGETYLLGYNGYNFYIMATGSENQGPTGSNTYVDSTTDQLIANQDSSALNFFQES